MRPAFLGRVSQYAVPMATAPPGRIPITSRLDGCAEFGARWVVEGGMAFEQGGAMMKLRVVDATTDQKIWADSFQSDIEALSAEQ